MKKIYLAILLISCSTAIFAQKKFEGEIDYKHFGLDDSKSDTIVGGPYKILFGKNAIRIDMLTENGDIFQQRIILLDSLKEIIIDARTKTYWEAWKFDKKVKLPYKAPWAMNKTEIIHSAKKVVGYETDLIVLTNANRNLDNGQIDLRRSKSLFYELKPEINGNLFLGGLLFFDNNIILGIKIASGEAPHSQENYLATKVEGRAIDPSEFSIPKGYMLKVIKNNSFKD